MKTFIKGFAKYIFLFLSIVLLSSCSSEGRLLKKFVSRMNANEFNASSIYIFPEDRAKLEFFAREVKGQSQSSFLKIVDYDSFSKGGDDYLKVTFQWENANSFIRNYFKQINRPLNDEGEFTDIIAIKETNDGDLLSFNWAFPNVDSRQIKLASVNTNNAQNMTIRKGPGGKAIINLKSTAKVTIDKTTSTNNWSHAFWVDSYGNIKDGYVDNQSISVSENSYFAIGIFDSMALVVAVIIIVAIAFFLVFGSAIFAMIGAIPVGGILIDIALIFGLIYTVYQCIEKILFELFIINLPY
jgi:hypothetical protein